MDIDVEPYLNLSSGMEFSNWKPEGWRVWEAGADLHCLGENHVEQPHLRHVPRQAQDWGGRGRQVFREDHGPHLSDIWRQVLETRRSQRSPAVAWCETFLWSWTTSRWWPLSRGSCPRRPPSPAWAGRRCTGCARATSSSAGCSSGSRGRRWRGTTSSSRRAASSCRPPWCWGRELHQEHVILPLGSVRSRKTDEESDARPKSSVQYCQFLL